MKKLKISHLCWIILAVVVLYYPFQIAKHYLIGLSYDEISDYEWRRDNNYCHVHDEDGQLAVRVKMSSLCYGAGLKSFDDQCKIHNDGYLYDNNKRIGKVIKMGKPSYFHTGEIFTGGSLIIQDIETNTFCNFDSVSY